MVAVIAATVLAFPLAVFGPAVAEAQTPAGQVIFTGKCKSDDGKSCKKKHKNRKISKQELAQLSDEDLATVAAVTEVLAIVAIASII
jgi:hypothetical protein